MTNYEKTKSKTIFSEWLEKLQQESWQLELLISGLALYGVIELGPLIDDLEVYHKLNTYGASSFFLFPAIIVARTGWVIFIINLLVHIILRGLWIGAIGLRYVSSEIEYDDLNYSTKFTQYLKNVVGDYDLFIEKLEKFCSVLFAFTFLLFLFFISFMLYFSIGSSIMVISTYYDMTSIPFSISILSGITFFLAGIIVFIDFITLGVFKKIEDEKFSKIYFYIYRFYSIVTLSFLYRPLIYNFIDNKYTRRFFFFSVVYITSILIFNSLFTNDVYPHFPDRSYGMEVGELINDNYYEDLRIKRMGMNNNTEKIILPLVSIDQFIYSKNHMTFFIRMLQSDQDLLMKKSNIDPFRKMGFRLGLFKNIAFEDTYIDSIEQLRKNEVINILKPQIKLVESAIIARNANEEVPNLRHQLDSMTIVKNEVNKKYQEIKDQFNDGKLNRIKTNLLSHIKIKIDSISIMEEIQCQFYVHPNLNEKGLLCFHDIKKYQEGQHKFIFEKEEFRYRRTKDTIMLRTIVLPFHKQKANE